jgi:phage terminase small subunit
MRKTTKPAAKKPARKAAPRSAKPASKEKPPAPAPARKAAKERPTETKVEAFIREYLIDLNGRQAAIRAGYSPFSARQTASDLLATPHVRDAVQAAMDARAERTGISADRVLERLWAIATADPRELIELQRQCCRHCYGIGHRYQFTRRELLDAEIEHEKRRADEPDKYGEFDQQGGDGYDPRKDPHPDCPECWGEGREVVVPKDSRDLSPSARLLYAGVKTTQHGLEIKTHSQVDALLNCGKHLGLFRDKLEVTLPADFESALIAARQRALRSRGGE